MKRFIAVIAICIIACVAVFLFLLASQNDRKIFFQNESMFLELANYFSGRSDIETINLSAAEEEFPKNIQDQIDKLIALNLGIVEINRNGSTVSFIFEPTYNRRDAEGIYIIETKVFCYSPYAITQKDEFALRWEVLNDNWYIYVLRTG